MIRRFVIVAVVAIPTFSASAQEYFLHNKEIDVNGMPMVARSFDGAMVGMEGVVTLHLLKLANGDLYYDIDLQNAEARQFNQKLCDSVDAEGPVPAAKLVIGGGGPYTIPMNCGAQKNTTPNSLKRSMPWGPTGAGSGWDYHPVLQLDYPSFVRAGSYSSVRATA